MAGLSQVAKLGLESLSFCRQDPKYRLAVLIGVFLGNKLSADATIALTAGAAARYKT